MKKRLKTPNMADSDIDQITKKLKKAIESEDRLQIIECCNQYLNHMDELELDFIIHVYNALAIAHLRMEHYLLSYQSSVKSLDLDVSGKNENGHQILGIVKAKIME
ncbi:MAG: hypothetical protein AB9846_02795 [Tenuifilaceae bacterium]